MDSKICNACHREFPLSEYYLRHTREDHGKDVYFAVCKPCVRARRRALRTPAGSAPAAEQAAQRAEAK